MKLKGCFIFIIVISLAFAGCKFFKKQQSEEQPFTETPQLQTYTEEQKPAEETDEAEQEAEQEEEKEETLVSKEDIEKAAKIYLILHDEERKEEVIKKEVVELFEKYGWDEKKYREVTDDIGRDPASSKIYKELIEQEEEEEE